MASMIIQLLLYVNDGDISEDSVNPDRDHPGDQQQDDDDRSYLNDEFTQ